ncbi:MAG: hypothetical protein AB7O52_13755 [Planctomycetota bacterium]
MEEGDFSLGVECTTDVLGRFSVTSFESRGPAMLVILENGQSQWFRCPEIGFGEELWGLDLVMEAATSLFLEPRGYESLDFGWASGLDFRLRVAEDMVLDPGGMIVEARTFAGARCRQSAVKTNDGTFHVQLGVPPASIDNLELFLAGCETLVLPGPFQNGDTLPFDVSRTPVRWLNVEATGLCRYPERVVRKLTATSLDPQTPGWSESVCPLGSSVWLETSESGRELLRIPVGADILYWIVAEQFVTSLSEVSTTVFGPFRPDAEIRELALPFLGVFPDRGEPTPFLGRGDLLIVIWGCGDAGVEGRVTLTTLEGHRALPIDSGGIVRFERVRAGTATAEVRLCGQRRTIAIDVAPNTVTECTVVIDAVEVRHLQLEGEGNLRNLGVFRIDPGPAYSYIGRTDASGGVGVRPGWAGLLVVGREVEGQLAFVPVEVSDSDTSASLPPLKVVIVKPPLGCGERVNWRLRSVDARLPERFRVFHGTAFSGQGSEQVRFVVPKGSYELMALGDFVVTLPVEVRENITTVRVH